MNDDPMNALPPPLPPPPPAPPRPSWWHVPLSRDRDDRKIGGVVGGMARAYGFDVRTSRIATAVAAIAVPGVFALYVAAWILLPKEPGSAKPLSAIIADRRRRPLLIVIGVIAVFSGFGSWSLFGGVGWGFALVAIGVVLWISPNFGAPTRAASTALAYDDATGGGVPGPAVESTPRRRRHPVQAVALALAALAALTMGIGNGADWWHVRVLTAALTVVGILIAGTLAGIIVNRSWFGAPMLVVFSVVLAALLIAHPNLDGGFGDRTVQPSTIADAGHVERLGAGKLTIDLTQLPSGEQPISIDAAVGFGQLRIIVPAADELHLTSHIGAGDVRLDGEEIINGVRHDDTRSLAPRAGATHGRSVSLDLEVGGGQITIDRVG